MSFTKQKKTWISSSHRGFADNGHVENTLIAFLRSAEKGADMIETDARMTADGVLVANHDPEVHGFDRDGNAVNLPVASSTLAEIKRLTLKPNGSTDDTVPTLEEVLNLAYYTGMCINIDLKEGIAHAEDVARLVAKCGMRGRTVYATNASGAEAIKKILAIDPEARFIDTKANFTAEKLAEIENYKSKCYVYTSDFSDENIAEIRNSGCMLATISLNSDNAKSAFAHHPDMAEYPHTSDFEEIDEYIISSADLSAQPFVWEESAVESAEKVEEDITEQVTFEAVEEPVSEPAEAEKPPVEQPHIFTIFCTECGNKLPNDALFCTECGTKIVLNFSEATPTEEPTVEEIAEEIIDEQTVVEETVKEIADEPTVVEETVEEIIDEPTVVEEACEEATEEATPEAELTDDFANGDDSIVCRACGAILKSDSRFCEMCGTRLGKRACKACGSELDDTALFCSECGTKVESL